MNVFLLYPDRDFDPAAPLPWQTEALEKDLGLPHLYAAMSHDDRFLYETARRVLLTSAPSVETIRYRQAIFQDCLAHPEVIQTLYQIPLEAQKQKQEQWLGIFSRSPQGILSSAVDLLRMLMQRLRHLRRIATREGRDFTSAGFRRFFNMLEEELSEAYFAEVEAHLRALKLKNGALLSARLGQGNEAADYTLRKPQPPPPILRQIFRRTPSCGFTIPPRDTYGAKALGEIKNRGLNEVANAVAQAADHIDGFLKQLQAELAFYLGGLHLAQQVQAWGLPFAFPDAFPPEAARWSARGLYDLSLALAKQGAVVGNDLEADGKTLVIITGANQGGKTTFLRSVGLAQMLLHAGLPVPAASMETSLAPGGVFTHFKREEDDALESGKLDEELGRMAAIADHLTPHSMVLFNESFASTNEREGSEIAFQVIRALRENHVRVFFVTHFYALAHRCAAHNTSHTSLFLRAERLPDGRRTFKIRPGMPEKTSFGEDVYRQVFEEVNEAKRSTSS